MDEQEFLISKIQSKHSYFDLSKIEMRYNATKSNLNVDDCIKYLKSEGYLIYKPV